MNKQIYLSEEDYNFLKLYLENLDELIDQDDYYELIYAVDDALVGELDENYNSTPISRELQRIYDTLCYNRSICNHKNNNG